MVVFNSKRRIRLRAYINRVLRSVFDLTRGTACRVVLT